MGETDSSDINNSYWDVESSRESTTAGPATGLTTSEMTGSNAETNMTGFYFSGVWETETEDYPEHQ